MCWDADTENWGEEMDGFFFILAHLHFWLSFQIPRHLIQDQDEFPYTNRPELFLKNNVLRSCDLGDDFRRPGQQKMFWMRERGKSLILNIISEVGDDAL